MLKEVSIPDVGSSSVDVIEILVKVGDKVEAETPLLTLESDKASMEVPAPFAGTVKEIKVKVGQKVAQGTVVMVFEAAETAAKPAEPIAAKTEPAPAKVEKPAEPGPATQTAAAPTNQTVTVPDLGNTSQVDVIEINVKVGDKVEQDQTLLTLESDKATMEVPSPYVGVVKAILVKKGDKVASGTAIVTVETQGQAKSEAAKPAETAAPVAETKAAAQPQSTAAPATTAFTASNLPADNEVYAGPAVRRFARELGVNLTQVKGSGRKGRIELEDVQAYVKATMQAVQAGGGAASGGGFALPATPVVDFTKFGEVTVEPLSRIKKISGANLQRNWIVVPHVTQFDEADITELEDFRKAANNDAQKQGVKLTPLVFIMKAVVAALKAHPTFNASLDATGENLILKQYYHIGVAVDTPNGLVVPVIRDVDKKGIYDLSRELAEYSEKARKKALTANDMQGSTFTISSLGGIGGTAFTPIVNLPDVAILGVSRSSIKPIYQNGQFVPRLMLPLSLSYDHRVIDGAEGARFSKYLTEVLSDIRKLLL
jgi:pyruvate dehydrogenase E2 component (dihydrolipoamide acetyltransferase)